MRCCPAWPRPACSGGRRHAPPRARVRAQRGRAPRGDLAGGAGSGRRERTASTGPSPSCTRARRWARSPSPRRPGEPVTPADERLLADPGGPGGPGAAKRAAGPGTPGTPGGAAGVPPAHRGRPGRGTAAAGAGPPRRRPAAARGAGGRGVRVALELVRTGSGGDGGAAGRGGPAGGPARPWKVSGTWRAGSSPRCWPTGRSPPRWRRQLAKTGQAVRASRWTRRGGERPVRSGRWRRPSTSAAWRRCKTPPSVPPGARPHAAAGRRSPMVGWPSPCGTREPELPGGGDVPGKTAPGSRTWPTAWRRSVGGLEVRGRAGPRHDGDRPGAPAPGSGAGIGPRVEVHAAG